MRAFSFTLVLFKIYQPVAYAGETIDIKAFSYRAPSQETLDSTPRATSLAVLADQICNTHASETPSFALSWEMEQECFSKVECEPKFYSPSERPHKPAPLSKEALELYQRASESGRYSVTTLQRTSGNSIQTVVLLGESHRKTKKISDIGKEFFKYFQAIGYENIQLPSLEDANALALLDGGFFAKHGLTTSRKYIPKRYIDSEPWDHGSTMDDLESEYSFLMTRLDEGTQWGITMIQNYGKTRGQAPILPKTIILDDYPNYLSFQVGAIQEPAESFLKSLGYKNEIHVLVRKASARIFFEIHQVVDLEGHAPPTEGTMQLLSSIKKSKTAGLLACTAMGAAVAKGLQNYFTGESNPCDSCLYTAALASAPTAIAYIKQFLNPVLPASVAVEVDPFKIDPVIDSRNPVLAQGIINTFEQRPDLMNHLAIVGSFHIPGMKEVLTNRHGFKVIKAF